ncbi:DUF2878 domain-containing protein [Alcanivorax sp. 24]|uniref:DUF2878 domain-containing protein n=1 Tax=Alcanivorax sp. 24 TaxID=2545266 RepID=UPI00105E84EC|nr:DUF2878 domain-containing protein [Alcanivorax sp. 24]
MAVAVIGSARQWVVPAWSVVVIMLAVLWTLERNWRADLRLLVAGALCCVLVEPFLMFTGVLHYVTGGGTWWPPSWIWSLWLGFAVSFNYSLAWLRRRPRWAAVVGAMGGVFSVTAGIRFGAASAPLGWMPMALCYAPIWAVIVPFLASLSRRERKETR